MPSRNRCTALVLASVALVLTLPCSLPADEPIPPARPFDPMVYQARRAKLMKALGGGIAVLYARGEEDADGYRQDADFYYLTGLNDAGAVLVLSPEERAFKERLFLKPRDPDDERWTGVRPDIGDSLRRTTGIERISRTSALGGSMMGLLQTTGTLYLISDPGGPDSPDRPEMELYGKLSSKLPGVSIKNRTDLLPALRSVKEPRELDYMEKAIAATVSAQHAAAQAIRPGVEENWVAGLIDLEFKRGGAVRPGFPPIVGSGRNSTILHYPEHNQTIAAGSLVVVDIGSDYGHYSADITRTYPADGHFTPEQRKVLRRGPPGPADVHGHDQAGRVLRRCPSQGGRDHSCGRVPGLLHPRPGAFRGTRCARLGPLPKAAAGRHGRHHRAWDLHSRKVSRCSDRGRGARDAERPSSAHRRSAA